MYILIFAAHFIAKKLNIIYLKLFLPLIRFFLLKIKVFLSLQLKKLNTAILSRIHETLREDVKACLNYTPELRPDAIQFTRVCGYFKFLSFIQQINF